jgi:hypothetical protein
MMVAMVVSMVTGTDCIGRCNFNYHMMVATVVSINRDINAQL